MTTEYDIDEILLNLLNDYPRIPTKWIARALDLDAREVRNHIYLLQAAQYINSYHAGGVKNYERLFFITGEFPEFFQSDHPPQRLEILTPRELEAMRR